MRAIILNMVITVVRVFVGKNSSLFQGDALVVIDTSYFSSHDAHENIVDAIQDLGSAPEVLIQVDPLCFRVVMTVCIIFLRKYFRPCQPESVYALLDITDHKAVVASFIFSGNNLQKKLLYLIAVLIFIDQNLCVMAAKRPGNTPWGIASVFVHHGKDLQGKMLTIHEINNMLLFLLFLQTGRQLHDQGGQGFDRLSRGLHHSKDHGGRLPADAFRKLLNQFLFPVPHPFNGFLQVLVVMGIFFSPQGGIFGKRP